MLVVAEVANAIGKCSGARTCRVPPFHPHCRRRWSIFVASMKQKKRADGEATCLTGNEQTHCHSAIHSPMIAYFFPVLQEQQLSILIIFVVFVMKILGGAGAGKWWKSFNARFRDSASKTPSIFVYQKP